VEGLLALYQEDFNMSWYELARELQDAQDSLFGGIGKRYSLSPVANSPLPPRQDYRDTELPSAQATAIANLLVLNAMSLEPGKNNTESERFLQKAEKLLLAVGDSVVKEPLAHASYLSALDLYMDSQTVVIVTPGAVKESTASGLLTELGNNYFPQAIYLASDANQVAQAPLVVRDKELYQGSAAVYILGSEGNIEFNHMVQGHDMDARAALDNPSEIRFTKQ